MSKPMLNEVTRIIEVLDSNLGLKSAEEIVKQIITEEENLEELWEKTGFNMEKLKGLLGKFLEAEQQPANAPKEPEKTSIQPSKTESTEQQPEEDFKHFIKTVATSKLEQGLTK
jgi:hypothetical protein